MSTEQELLARGNFNLSEEQRLLSRGDFISNEEKDLLRKGKFINEEQRLLSKGMFPTARLGVPAKRRDDVSKITRPARIFGAKDAQPVSAEPFATGVPYWTSRLGSVAEQIVMGTAALPFEIQRFLSKVGGFKEAAITTKAIEVLDPYQNGMITPKVEQTRAFRDAFYYQHGKLRGHLNRVLETGTDLAGLLAEIALLKKAPGIRKIMLPGKGAIGKLQAAKKSGKYAKGLIDGLHVAGHAKNAALMGINAAVVTPGTVEERAKRAVTMVTYGLTPIATGCTGVTGKWAPRAVDFMLN